MNFKHTAKHLMKIAGARQMPETAPWCLPAHPPGERPLGGIDRPAKDSVTKLVQEVKSA